MLKIATLTPGSLRNAVFTAGFLGLLTACGGGGSTGNTPPSQPSGPGVYVGNTAVEITGVDAAGQTRTLSSLKGQVVLLCYSTMWCGPCKAEAPTLEAFHQKYKGRGFTILQCVYQNEGGGSPSAADLKRWCDSYGLTFHVVNPGSASASTYQIRAIPTNLLVDKAGVIQYRQEGFDEATLAAKVEALLK